MLVQTGDLPADLRTNPVAQLDGILRRRGWHVVSARDAQPGDVMIIQGGGVSHTETISGSDSMIGSNDVNADGTRRVSIGSLDRALRHGAVILRAPS